MKKAKCILWKGRKEKICSHGTLSCQTSVTRIRIMGNWVNEKQTKAERRFKYQLARIMGISQAESARIRNWTWNHYRLFLRSRKLIRKR